MMIFLWAPVLTVLALQGVDGTSWPEGKYALLKPATGCPEGWEGRGWLVQDTEDTNPSNKRSEILHADGLVTPSNVIRSFCVKTAATDQEPNWPQGQFCIYKKRGENTLTGMRAGSIKMYDETTSNKDTAIYVSYSNWIRYSLSDWYNHLVLYFQCKTSGNKKIPISLPITKPFYLLPYGSRDCQQVKWMVATSEWIKYHTDNYEGINYKGGTAVPHHELGNVRNNKGITMYYCYYQSCNYTLSGTKGVFQSPAFPGKYPDGQLCSWMIMVPDSHTLHVHFTNFSLDENDNVMLFKNSSGSFHLHDTFPGHLSLPFTITATTDVLFVLRTNEEGKNTGFRAEYIVSKASETTPSPPPITTENSGQHTTLNTNKESKHGTTTPTTENSGQYTTLNRNTGSLHGSTIPTTETKNKSNNSTADTFKKSRVGECDGPEIAVLVAVPLTCLIVVIAVVIIILYRWRSKKTECEKCSSTRYSKEDAMNPTYDDAVHIQINQRISTAAMNTTLGTDDKDGQMYQALSGDHDQQPEYEAPDYSKQNGIDDPSNDPGYPEYHELEPMDNIVPDVVYDVLEGPDSNDGPSGDQLYQALDEKTTHNSLYQTTHPATMVTQNPMYVDSTA